LLFKHYERNGKQVPVFLAILSSSENEFLFREQAQKYANLDIVITNDFQKLKDGIERHLLLNHVVFILIDFSNAKQLRVPFIHGDNYYDFLMPFPQLASYFHFKFGTPVIPCVNFIRDDFSKTFSKYYPEIDLSRNPHSEQNILIRNELIRFQTGEMDENEKYGLLSTEINRILNPFILQYPFYWEEVYPFWKRSSYPIDLTLAEKVKEFIEIYAEGLLSLLNNSFEPGRETKKIKNILEQIIISAKSVEPKFIIENRHLLINYDLGRKNWNSIIKEFQNTIQDATEQVKNNEKVAKIWSLMDQLE
jgi:hypothetical protein